MSVGNDFDSPEYENLRYDWLPSETDIPKQFGKPLPEKDLESLEVSAYFNSQQINKFESI